MEKITKMDMSSESDLISVIMPCFNQEAFIEDAVASVFNQTYSNVFLIVVDDGSTDSSWTILSRLEKKHKGQLLILQQENEGPYPARNWALKHAKGEFIAFLDGDDFWDQHFLRKMYDTLVLKGADLVYCGWQNIGEGAPDGHPYIPPEYDPVSLVEEALRSCPWPIHAALTKKNVVDEVKGFSERYFSSMDYDFWLRIITVTQKIVLHPEVLSYYRWHNRGQISSVKWKQALDSWHVRKDFVKNHPDLTTQISPEKLHQIVDCYLLKTGYRAYWDRDLKSARHLFLKALGSGCWKIEDLKYLLPSLLPEKIYVSLLNKVDSLRRTGKRV